MNNRTVVMNYIVAALIVLSLCYQLFHEAHTPLGALIVQLLVLAAPLATVWALKAPTMLSRRTAFTANVLITALVVGTAAMALRASSNIGAALAMAVLFVPFPINLIVLSRKEYVSPSI